MAASKNQLLPLLNLLRTFNRKLFTLKYQLTLLTYNLIMFAAILYILNLERAKEVTFQKAFSELSTDTKSLMQVWRQQRISRQQFQGLLQEQMDSFDYCRATFDGSILTGFAVFHVLQVGLNLFAILTCS
mmetsp:Transcript_3748/g.6390  ORF Transcript_3748/g.6390 Transcript_3748/m.6390 type:complete len:130 (+) Transcript_3748:127-516(+)|eukprot:CAMPEP_0168613854 /NCGR_PEP_ID=MMETSP0449_2-20121227/3667_1 /TAXON_ID=1082188 /ORGANISM="Strombidium rassoulzadegani, Strain ras09" /LENGTH=129 /DNA_ID=CAMNT_0008654503 /DNA_START=53 /DNA_END=445 /DNA_ORIENTATION=-